MAVAQELVGSVRFVKPMVECADERLAEEQANNYSTKDGVTDEIGTVVELQRDTSIACCSKGGKLSKKYLAV